MAITGRERRGADARRLGVALPAPDRVGTMTLEQALARRRSVRTFLDNRRTG
ncbi:MAG: hypothetical protein ACYTGN_12830 [Planctomycetota bacterium]